MPINYSDHVKGQRLAMVINNIDAAAPNPGKLVLVLRELTVYVDGAVIPFAVPSFEHQRMDMIRMRGGPYTVNAIATGNIVTARIEDGNVPPNIVGTGLTVDVAGNADVLVSSLFITAGNPVTVYSGTITHG